MNKKQPRNFRVLAGLVALLAVASPTLAQVAPNLGTLSTRGIAASTFTNNGGTTVVGDLCFTTGTGVATVTVTGTTATPCPPAATTDQNSALATIMGQACTALPAGTPLELVSIGGGPAGEFAPGCYTSVGALNISAGGIVTLTGNGIFVFRSTGGAINTGATSIVRVQGGACAGNVFFGANALTTLGAASTFVGTIVDPAGVTVGGGGTSVLGRLLAPSGTVTTDGNAITVPAACAPPPPSITVTKVSNGGVGSFNFTGTNGFAAQTITTTAPGTGVSGATQILAAANVSTTLTEGVPPAGFGLTSISCSGLGAGGSAIVNIPARSVTLDAAATATGAAISCTFTNTLPPPGVVPTVTLTKISNGGTGSFNFTGSNGFTAQTITTTTPGAATSALTQSLTAAGVITTLTEGVPPAGFALTSITCSGLGAGGTATPNIATRTVTLDAAATAAGSTIACTFTNTFAAVAGGPAAAIPTLSEWAMILLAALLAMAGFAAIRRRNSR